MNQYKACFFKNPNDLHRHRLAVTQKELTEFWSTKSLLELQNILCIKDQYLIHNMIYLPYLQKLQGVKKISPGQIFYPIYKDQILAYVYDAKIFRNSLFQKYDNDLLSTFLIVRRIAEEIPTDEVFEFLDFSIVEPQRWILKIKESAILRIFPYLINCFLQKKESCFDPSLRNSIGSYYLSRNPNIKREVVILDPKVYYHFINSLVSQHSMNPQISVKRLFEQITELMLNNLLIAWYQSLTPEQQYSRHFKEYFRLIQKPRNKEQFTSIDNRFTEIKWQTFKLNVFKLKYKVKETEDNYQCYQIDMENQEQLNDPYQDLSIDDQNLIKAFYKKKIQSPDYHMDYALFYGDALYQYENLKNQQQ